MSQNISKCRKGYREGEFAPPVGGDWERPPPAAPPPAQVPPSRGPPGFPFVNQPRPSGLLAKAEPTEARVWPVACQGVLARPPHASPGPCGTEPPALEASSWSFHCGHFLC